MRQKRKFKDNMNSIWDHRYKDMSSILDKAVLCISNQSIICALMNIKKAIFIFVINV
jgi:hypothetical protein